MVTCKCEECQNEFEDEFVETIRYQEYSGAATQKEFVSPCCHASYYEKD